MFIDSVNQSSLPDWILEHKRKRENEKQAQVAQKVKEERERAGIQVEKHLWRRERKRKRAKIETAEVYHTKSCNKLKNRDEILKEEKKRVMPMIFVFTINFT